MRKADKQNDNILPLKVFLLHELDVTIMAKWKNRRAVLDNEDVEHIRNVNTWNVQWSPAGL